MKTKELKATRKALLEVNIQLVDVKKGKGSAKLYITDDGGITTAFITTSLTNSDRSSSLGRRKRDAKQALRDKRKHRRDT